MKASMIFTFPTKVIVPRQLHTNTELKVAEGDDRSQKTALTPLFPAEDVSLC